MEYILEKIGTISAFISIVMGMAMSSMSDVNYLLAGIFSILTMIFWGCAIASIIILYRR